MLRKFHKTTSECWQKTPDIQKGSPFSSKGGRTKYKRQKERHFGEGVVKEEKFPNSRKSSHQWVFGEFWNLRGKDNWEGEKKMSCLTATLSREVAQMLSSTISKRAGQGGAGCVLRVRTGPGCPEDNLRELM